MLVTDGEQRASLAIVRSLGNAGYPVHVTSRSGRSLAGASRYCRSDTAVPDPLSDPVGFTDTVQHLSLLLEAKLLLPVTEASILVLRQPGATLPLIPFPDLARFAAICDKERVLHVAAECGIAIPKQVVTRNRAELSAAIISELSYPVVIKPTRSVGGHGSHRVKLSVAHAAEASQLIASIARFPDTAFPLLLQQRIVGPGIGIFLLVWNGRVVAQFSHQRIREKPPAGGVSVYRESIVADEALVMRSRQLLDRFAWSGVAMIEYKLDDRTGIPYLMEINGRFWGSLQLAIDAGVDFPRLLVELARGENPSPIVHYRTGVRSRWWWGDVDHLVTRLRRSDAALGLPPGTPSRVKALVDFLTLWRPGDRNEILRWSDPVPFARETMQWLKGQS